MNVKLLEGGFLPKRKYPTDAGCDLFSPIGVVLLPGDYIKIPLAISIEIEPGCVALVQGRSGLATKNGINTIGNVIDCGYTGEISATLVNNSKEKLIIEVGDRIAQLLILKLGNPEIIEVNSLTESARGTAGFGSSGK